MAEDTASADDEPIEPMELARLTAGVVSAYFAHNAAPTSEVPGLIALVSRELGRIGGQAQEDPSPAKPEPAVPVRRSISPDHLTCLVCGKAQKLLKRHLSSAHELTPVTYRERFELKSNYPMVAPNYAQQRSEMARAIGLGQKQPPPPPPRRRTRRASTKA